MKTSLGILLLALVSTFFASIGSAESKVTPVVDISGNWAFTVVTAERPGAPTFVFAQKGETLTGTYTGYFGSAPLTGTVKDGKVSFTVKTEANGQEIDIVYTGEVAGDTMKGKIDFGGYAEGTFTGKRAP